MTGKSPGGATNRNEFDPLFAIKGSERQRLFDLATLAAKLKHENPGRYEALLDTLRSNGMKRLVEFDRHVNQIIRRAEKKARYQPAASKQAPPPPDGTVVINLRKPLEVARKFVATSHPTLLQHKGDWLEYSDNRYSDLEQLTVDNGLTRFLERTVVERVDPITRQVFYAPVNPEPSMVAGIGRMLEIDTHRAANAFAPPCWLDPQPDDPPAGEIMACANGLLHLPTGRLLKPSPRFFTLTALPFAYDPNAPTPKRWMQFLEEVWPDSPESRECLQEMVGFLLTPDTSLQKIFLLIGRSRGGKGTIIRVVVYLLGSSNHASPTMEQLAGPFGMQSLIGKSLVSMTDLYVHRASAASVAVEHLLRISGGDDVTVTRKHKTDWVGRLPGRFLLAGTVAPILPDMSGALANRYVPLVIKESFLGREDPYLFEEKLIPEMGGILNWAIEGWRRLKERGFFKLTADGEALVRDIRARANPVAMFMRERCVLERGARTKKEALFNEFELWAETVDGMGFRYMDQSDFSRRLVAASGYRIDETRPRTGVDGEQERHYAGIRLRDELDD